MRLDFGPLEKWLYPSSEWDRADARAWWRAKKNGWISEETADRLCLRYAHIQLELIHPDVHP
jgi:hypothetical protein